MRQLPELPLARRDRLIEQRGLPRYDAEVLTAEKDVADYFEEVLACLCEVTGMAPAENAKTASNWVMTEVLRVMGERRITISDFPVRPDRLAAMISLVLDGTISGTIAKDLFGEMLSSNNDPKRIVEEKEWIQISDSASIERVIDEILRVNPTQVEQYLRGNEKLFGFFVGQTMRSMKGKGNPKLVNEILHQKLSSVKK